MRPRFALALVALLWAAALLFYRETLATMVATWSESDTFAHGFVVPPIALWLAWRKRAELAALVPTIAAAPSALLIVAAAGAAWLVGEAAEVNALRQFALVTMLVALVPAVVGWPIARALAFPLGFLYFAVPFGEFLLPVLMRHTADFTVFALRATGIPVYRDGLDFVIPTGNWSVVEACSGVRYLIASAMGGALFAYLHYRSARRRWLFMAFALALPIVANWLRAYLIVLIGHTSGNRLAVGVDHLIYGWVFFGVVIGTLFFVGMRWAQADAPPAMADAALPAPTRAPWGQVAAAGAAIMLMALPLASAWQAGRAVEMAAPHLQPPRSLAQLPPADDARLAEWQPAFSRPAASFNQRYATGVQPVGLYVGYYRHQRTDSKLVSSINMLVRSDDAQWNQVESGTRTLALPAGPVPVHAARLRPRGARVDPGVELTAWRLYWIDGAFEASDARAKLRGAWQRLRGRGDDGAALVLYTAAPSRAEADAALERFVRDHLAALQTQLRAARDGD